MRKPRTFLKIALLSPLLLSCSSKGYYQKVVFAMDTQILCQAQAEKEEELEEVLSPFEQIDKIADANSPHYQTVSVYDINKAPGEIEISKELFDLLSFALEMEKETEGYFNPLCFGLSTLWKNHLHPLQEGESPSLPSPEDIAEELSKIKNTDLLLSGEGGVYRAELALKEGAPVKEKAQIDLGGIAKGYAAELSKKKAEEKGWEHYYINGGNSTMVFGSKEGGDGTYSLSWKQDLPGKRLFIKNACLSTSSVSVQGVEIEGKVYSHIVNPFTGEASPSFTGVTLKGEDAGKLDAYTTALMWVEPEKREGFEKKWGVSGVYYKDGEVIEDRLLS